MALAASPLPCSEVAGVVLRQSCAAWTSPRAGLCRATKSCLASNQLVGSKADRRVAATNQAAERCAGDKRHCSGIWKANGAVKKKQWQQQSKLGVEVDIALMGLWRGVRSRVGLKATPSLCFVVSFAACRGRPRSPGVGQLT